MIQQTSLDAYDQIKKHLGNRQLAVYLCLKGLQSANNTMISKKMGLSINQVVPRINELRKMGLVSYDNVKQCPITCKFTLFWKISDIFVPEVMEVD